MTKQDAINEAKQDARPGGPTINIYETYDEYTGRVEYEYGPEGYGLFPPDAKIVDTITA